MPDQATDCIIFANFMAPYGVPTLTQKRLDDFTKDLTTSRPKQNGRLSASDFSKIFSCIKIVFWYKFHWSLFAEVQLTIASIGLSNGLVPLMLLSKPMMTKITDAYICDTSPLSLSLYIYIFTSNAVITRSHMTFQCTQHYRKCDGT